MRYIIQVLGNLDGYKCVSFRIYNHIYKEMLVSEAVYEFFGKNCEIVLLVPESLVTMLVDDIEKAEELLCNKREFAERIRERVMEEGLAESPRILIMQSVGSYPHKSDSKWRVCFKNYLDNIVSYTMIDLLKSLEKDDNYELLVNVSTGQNIYVNALVEAVRASLVYYKLCGIIQGRPGVRVTFISHPPILNDGEYEYPVDFYEYDVKAFFEFPIKEEIPTAVRFLSEGNAELKQMLGRNLSNESKNISNITSLARMAFNAIKYNTPLTMLCDYIIKLDFKPQAGLNALIKILETIENMRAIKIMNNTIKVLHLRVNRPLIVNTLLSFALYSSLRDLWEKVRSIKPTVQEIRYLFKDVYEKIGLDLNIRFLERDLDDIENVVCKLKDEEEVRLRDLREEERMKVAEAGLCGYVSDEKRNFFAHSGLLDNMVFVKKEGDDILLRYDPEVSSKIKKWLKGPGS